MTKKRQRTDTAAGEANAMRGALTKIDPPKWVNVPDDALPFWYSITRARAVDRWTEPDLEMAAELARTKWRIEETNKVLAVEGDIVKNDRGTPIENPRNRLLETLTRRTIALSRALHVHAEATVGEAREQRKVNAAQGKARKTTESVQDDDLIAKPTH